MRRCTLAWLDASLKWEADGKEPNADCLILSAGFEYARCRMGSPQCVLRRKRTPVAANREREREGGQ